MVHKTPFFAVEEERQREARTHTVFFFFFHTDEQHAAFFFVVVAESVSHTEGIERKTAVSLKGRCDDELVYRLEQYQICQR